MIRKNPACNAKRGYATIESKPIDSTMGEDVEDYGQLEHSSG